MSNQSTPEVTRADREAMDRLKRFADSPDATVSEHADIITVLSLIDRLAHTTPARGGDELREALEPFLHAAEPILHNDRGRWNPDQWTKRWKRISVGNFRRLHAAALASTDMTGAGETCDLCDGSGRNNHSQLWPDYPPACRACNGTGRLAAQPLEGLTSGEGVCARERIGAYIAGLLNVIQPFASAAEHADAVNAEHDPAGGPQVYPWNYVNPTHFADAFAIFSERLDPDDRAMFAASPKAPATASVREDRFANDAAAKALYDTWADQPGWLPWVDRGNSDMQERARREVML